MGEALGVQYTQLWQETAQLNIMWKEFIELFGTKPSRIELLNRSAGAFFRMVQDGIWEAIVLHIARLTTRRNHRVVKTAKTSPSTICRD